MKTRDAVRKLIDDLIAIAREATSVERAATWSAIVNADGEPAAPTPPAGDGWRLVAVAIASNRAIAYWERARDEDDDA